MRRSENFKNLHFDIFFLRKLISTSAGECDLHYSFDANVTQSIA